MGSKRTRTEDSSTDTMAPASSSAWTRVTVVSDNDTVVTCRRGQDRRVAGRAQVDILGVRDIESGLGEAFPGRVRDVFVQEQPNHADRRSSGTTRASDMLAANASACRTSSRVISG